MTEKLDRILDAVKDPESQLPISRLGLVKRFRYSKKHGILYVFIDFLSHRPSCKTCAGISMLIESSITGNLKNALEKEFPELSIRIV
ncbi:MAG: hypothetical protein GXP33_07340 [Spirochaetes bacterium]|nr:hypothetical protein [Spirochaetota bacterium]